MVGPIESPFLQHLIENTNESLLPSTFITSKANRSLTKNIFSEKAFASINNTKAIRHLLTPEMLSEALSYLENPDELTDADKKILETIAKAFRKPLHRIRNRKVKNELISQIAKILSPPKIQQSPDRLDILFPAKRDSWSRR